MGKWLTTFNDLVTLLMVFFVLLFTMSSTDIKKLHDIQDSLQSGLGVLREGKRMEVGKPELLGKYKMDDLTSQVEGRFDAQNQGMEKKEILESLKGVENILVASTENGLVISIKDTVLFDSGSAGVKDPARKVLEETGGHSLQCPVRNTGRGSHGQHADQYVVVPVELGAVHRQGGERGQVLPDTGRDSTRQAVGRGVWGLQTEVQQ